MRRWLTRTVAVVFLLFGGTFLFGKARGHTELLGYQQLTGPEMEASLKDFGATHPGFLKDQEVSRAFWEARGQHKIGVSVIKTQYRRTPPKRLWRKIVDFITPSAFAQEVDYSDESAYVVATSYSSPSNVWDGNVYMYFYAAGADSSIDAEINADYPEYGGMSLNWATNDRYPSGPWRETWCHCAFNGTSQTGSILAKLGMATSTLSAFASKIEQKIWPIVEATRCSCNLALTGGLARCALRSALGDTLYNGCWGGAGLVAFFGNWYLSSLSCIGQVFARYVVYVGEVYNDC